MGWVAKGFNGLLLTMRELGEAALVSVIGDALETRRMRRWFGDQEDENRLVLSLKRALEALIPLPMLY